MLKVDIARKPYLFWDIDLTTFDASKYPEFTIARILEHGALVDISWMFKNFSREKVIETIYSTNNISKRSANFWSNIFNLDKGKVKCLNKESIKIQREF